jgi:SAM-dependent methyltransferase
MSDIRQIDDDWNEHFANETVEKQVLLTKKEEALPLFYKYLRKDGMIVDLGCGLGKHLLYWHAEGYKIAGIDSEQRCISKIIEYCPDADAKLGDILFTPYKNETVDYCISYGVVEHFEEGPHKAFVEMHRILRKNGKAFVSVPHNNCLYRFINSLRSNSLLRKLMGKKTLDTNNNDADNNRLVELVFTRQEISDYFIKAGFVVVEGLPILTKWGFCNIFKVLRIKNFPKKPTYETLLDPPLTRIGNLLYALIMKIDPWLIGHFQVFVITKK